MFPYVKLAGDEWQTFKRTVLRRAGYRCERCGNARCDVYPRDGRSWDAAAADQYAVLCSSCLRRSYVRRALAHVAARLRI